MLNRYTGILGPEKIFFYVVSILIFMYPPCRIKKNSCLFLASAFSLMFLDSCSVKLSDHYYQKSLPENNFVENSGNDYALHMTDKSDVSGILVRKAADSPPMSEPVGDLIEMNNRKTRPYFELVSGGDTSIVTNRRVDFKKAVNFRDIGGIKTMDGKTVRWGKVFRSDNLSKIKSREFDKFNDLNIKTVYDLRTDHEIEGKEDHLPAGVRYVHAPTVADNEGQIAQLRAKVIGGEINEEEARAQTLSFYKETVTVNLATLKPTLLQIVNSDEPVLYHCSAGKDRTGIVSALILSVLRVDRETIVKEYLLSNYYRRAKTEKLLRKAKMAKVIKPKMDLKAIEVFMTVDESYIRAVFDVIDKEYGGIDKFIQNQLGIDDAMRERIVKRFTY